MLTAEKQNWFVVTDILSAFRSLSVSPLGIEVKFRICFTWTTGSTVKEIKFH